MRPDIPDSYVSMQVKNVETSYKNACSMHYAFTFVSFIFDRRNATHSSEHFNLSIIIPWLFAINRYTYLFHNLHGTYHKKISNDSFHSFIRFHSHIDSVHF